MACKPGKNAKPPGAFGRCFRSGPGGRLPRNLRGPYRLQCHRPPRSRRPRSIWSLMKRFMADFAAAGYDPHHQAQAEEDLVPAPLIDCCLADTGPKIEP